MVVCKWLVAVLLALPLSVGAGCNDDPQGETCGGKSCKTSERCCGPASCGFCVDKHSRISCPSTCADVTVGDGPKGTPCGGTTCGEGQFCCGPLACGFCAPNGSGVACPQTCPDASPRDGRSG